MSDGAAGRGTPWVRMISSGDHPQACGSFACSDQHEHEPIEHALLVRALGRQRRADRETLRDVGPPCGGYAEVTR